MWPLSLQKKHFTYDVSDVPSFALSLLFPLPFSLPLPLPSYLCLFMSASTSIGVVSFPSAMPHCLYCFMHRFPLTSESMVPLQPRRVQSNVPAPFWILWVLCQYCCFDRVLKRV